MSSVLCSCFDGLLYGTASIAEYMAPDGRMIGELNRKRRNAVVLFRVFPGNARETTSELIHKSLCPNQILNIASHEQYYKTLEID
jgi:hypothetical protein